ncbi:MAG: hypothetical protein QNJ84_07610 [Alphaproteobacteria bacterium]|nr:hypothetical protein [Alphaproteobacteria bacterium]
MAETEELPRPILARSWTFLLKWTGLVQPYLAKTWNFLLKWVGLERLILSAVAIVFVALVVFLLIYIWDDEPAGLLYIETPQVFTRERLVNDRLKEAQWLNAELTQTRKEEDYQRFANAGSRDMERLWTLVAVGGQDAVESPTRNDTESSGAVSVELDPFDVLERRIAHRNRLRTELMNSQLDDGHDLAQSTLYRLNFDVTALPWPHNSRRSAGLFLFEVREPTLNEPVSVAALREAIHENPKKIDKKHDAAWKHIASTNDQDLELLRDLRGEMGTLLHHSMEGRVESLGRDGTFENATNPAEAVDFSVLLRKEIEQRFVAFILEAMDTSTCRDEPVSEACKTIGFSEHGDAPRNRKAAEKFVRGALGLPDGEQSDNDRSENLVARTLAPALATANVTTEISYNLLQVLLNPFCKGTYDPNDPNCTPLDRDPTGQRATYNLIMVLEALRASLLPEGKICPYENPNFWPCRWSPGEDASTAEEAIQEIAEEFAKQTPNRPVIDKFLKRFDGRLASFIESGSVDLDSSEEDPYSNLRKVNTNREEESTKASAPATPASGAGTSKFDDKNGSSQTTGLEDFGVKDKSGATQTHGAGNSEDNGGTAAPPTNREGSPEHKAEKIRAKLAAKLMRGPPICEGDPDADFGDRTKTRKDTPQLVEAFFCPPPQRLAHELVSKHIEKRLSDNRSNANPLSRFFRVSRDDCDSGTCRIHLEPLPIADLDPDEQKILQQFCSDDFRDDDCGAFDGDNKENTGRKEEDRNNSYEHSDLKECAARAFLAVKAAAWPAVRRADEPAKALSMAVVERYTACRLGRWLNQQTGDMSVYSVAPRILGAVRDIDQQLDIAASIAADALAAFGSVNAGVGRTRDLIERRNIPTLIGFSTLDGDLPKETPRRTVRFGWAFLQEGSDGRRTERLSAIVSVPSWWGAVDVEARACWADAETLQESIEEEGAARLFTELCGEKDDATFNQEFHLKLPRRAVEIASRFHLDVIKTPYFDWGWQNDLQASTDAALELESGRRGSLVLVGERLWRGTVVSLAGQTATRVEVLPDMRGIVAYFQCVEPLVGGRTQIPSAPLRVWTAEGRTNAVMVNVHPWRSRGSDDQPCYAAGSRQSSLFQR